MSVFETFLVFLIALHVRDAIRWMVTKRVIPFLKESRKRVYYYRVKRRSNRFRREWQFLEALEESNERAAAGAMRVM